MGLVRKTAVCILAVIVMAPAGARAAQDNYEIDIKDLGPAKAKAKPQAQPQATAPATGEIDLKELRKIAPTQHTKPTQHKHHSQAAAPEAATTSTGSGQESIHVVQPGEHLFLILMKQYGLSDAAAERLIPEVMKLNGISSPKGLKVGQRLRIPLPARDGKHIVAQPLSAPKPHQQTSTAQQPETPAPATVSAPSQAPAPTAAPAPGVAAQTTPPATAQTAPTQTAAPKTATVPLPAQATIPASAAKPAKSSAVTASISIVSSSPCELVHNMALMMGLLAPPPTGVQGVAMVGTVFAGRSVIVACGLSKAEQYTYERLLTHSGKQLLVFEGDEADDYVVEELADGLGLVYRKSDPDAEELPFTYIFAPFGSWQQGVQLTILPVQAPPPPPATAKPEK